MKAKLPYTLPFVRRKKAELEEAEAVLKSEWAKLRQRCPHEWRKIGSGDDHDGWSRNVTVTYRTDYYCDLCRDRRTEETKHFRI